MKIIAINGSPLGKKAKTYTMLSALLEGMEKSSATEIINVAELNIGPCRGCLTCLQVTPGKCVLKDDMAALIEKLSNADFIIYGTPLYFWSMSGLMKNFIDRSLGLEAIRTKKQKMLLVSPCGCQSIDGFSALVTTFKHIAKMTDREYLGEILRTTAECDDKEKWRKYLDHLSLAGAQLINLNKIDENLLASLHEPWISLEEWTKMYQEVHGKCT